MECKVVQAGLSEILITSINGTKVECKGNNTGIKSERTGVLMEPKWNVKMSLLV